MSVLVDRIRRERDRKAEAALFRRARGNHFEPVQGQPRYASVFSKSINGVDDSQRHSAFDWLPPHPVFGDVVSGVRDGDRWHYKVDGLFDAKLILREQSWRSRAWAQMDASACVLRSAPSYVTAHGGRKASRFRPGGPKVQVVRGSYNRSPSSAVPGVVDFNPLKPCWAVWCPACRTWTVVSEYAHALESLQHILSVHKEQS